MFTRHKSVTDLGKRREIVVPGKAKSKASQKQVKQAAKKGTKNSTVIFPSSRQKPKTASPGTSSFVAIHLCGSFNSDISN